MTDSTPSLDGLRIDRDRRDDRSRGVWVGVLVVALLGAGVAGTFLWQRQHAGVPVRTHTVVAAMSGGGQVVLNGSGYVVARRAATVSSKVTGKVVEVRIEEGQQVQKGEVLARLDDTNVQAALRLAEAERTAAQAATAETRASFDQAERELRRIESLSRGGVASESELDGAQAMAMTLAARLEREQAQVEVAERAVDLRRQDLDDTIIRAPFSGMATAKNAQPGEMISPISAGGGFTRTGIGTIVDMESLEIEVEVNESYLQRVHPQQPVEAVLDAYPDWKIAGRVIAIIPTADRQKATVKVRVGFAQLDPRILPEMGVRVAFLSETETAADAVVVPRGALRQVEGRDVVWRVIEGRVEHRPVRLGLLQTDEAIVTEGLEVGDRVIVQAPGDLAPNTRVREQQP
jgi:HlyD family secretion protein